MASRKKSKARKGKKRMGMAAKRKDEEYLIDCLDCRGSGVLFNRICTVCNGHGKLPLARPATITADVEDITDDEEDKDSIPETWDDVAKRVKDEEVDIVGGTLTLTVDDFISALDLATDTGLQSDLTCAYAALELLEKVRDKEVLKLVSDPILKVLREGINDGN